MTMIRPLAVEMDEDHGSSVLLRHRLPFPSWCELKKKSLLEIDAFLFLVSKA